MKPTTIRDGMVVSFHYVLRDADSVLDDSRQRDTPMVYIHGRESIVPGLENAMSGHQAGDVFRVEVPPELGYGIRRGSPKPIPRSFFGDDADLHAGDSFTTTTPEGRPMMLWIAEVSGDEVLVDPYHPLAGRLLTYAVEVLSIRPATPEEEANGLKHKT
jgi:FKBP-type peptidyl-prolyl cis-trans isomerase SlyD